MNRRSWLLLILAGIVFSSLGILFASAMLFSQPERYNQLDRCYAPSNNPCPESSEFNEHPPCDGGYNNRYNMPSFSPYGP